MILNSRNISQISVVPEPESEPEHAIAEPANPGPSEFATLFPNTRNLSHSRNIISVLSEPESEDDDNKPEPDSEDDDNKPAISEVIPEPDGVEPDTSVEPSELEIVIFFFPFHV